MNKRTRHPKEFVRQLFVPEAVLSRRLSRDGLSLYVFLLANYESVDGPLGELADDRYFRDMGIGKTAIERAGRELAEKGLYSYGWDRRSDGTFARVQAVTEVPDALPRPEPSRRAAPAARTAATSGNASRNRAEQVRPAKTSSKAAVSAGRDQFWPQGAEQVRPAETVAEAAVSAGRDQFWPQGAEQVRPAETVAEPAVSAGRDQFWPQGAEQVRPAEMHPGDDVLAGQDGSGSRARLPYKHQPTNLEGNPPPSPQELPGPRRHPEEGILISVGDARAWLQRLPFRSRLRPGTSLGPVVAEFLSAPGAWPREVLKAELCRDLETARNVEAVLHARLKDANPVYDPAEYPTGEHRPNHVAIEGERVPIEALKPAAGDRTAATDEYRQALAQFRASKEARPRG